ncbi:SNF2-related protein [Penicillium subrubescens]|uniref:SNF2-related protein n=1 Tax=Penicillium subrubescens TaxID=1316194 RepID=UPI002545B945|nr:SNF2-related protein [Penicillium subrubescens]KAJ5883519.1 SNF2-related protein [Penicillium subrubescens]
MQRQEDKEELIPYHASLILVPARVIIQWVGQVDRFFGNQFRVLIFWGDPDHIGDAERKERTIGSLDDLLDKLHNLAPEDPKSAYTLVISSYDTFRVRIRGRGADAVLPMS